MFIVKLDKNIIFNDSLLLLLGSLISTIEINIALNNQHKKSNISLDNLKKNQAKSFQHYTFFLKFIEYW